MAHIHDSTDSSPVLIGTSISYTFPDGEKLFESLSFSLTRKKTAIIGINGSGKSTLMRIAAGLLKPSTGEIVHRGTLLYLPQTSVDQPDSTIADALGISGKLSALERLGAGDDDPRLFETIGEDWLTAERATTALEKFELQFVRLNSPVDRLSPGERMRLRLVRIDLQAPDLLLLDEPTNHLDAAGRRWMKQTLEDYKGAVLLISHDRELLETVENTWELTASGLQTFGGGYSFYKEIKEAHRSRAELRLTYAKQEADLRAKQGQDAKLRQQKRIEKGKKIQAKGGIPRIAAGLLKRRAQETLAKTSGLHDKRVEAANSELTLARTQAPIEASIVIDAHYEASPEGLILVHAKDFNCAVPTENGLRWLWSADLNFTLKGRERWALTGANGSGKSTLLRRIESAACAKTNDRSKDSAPITRGELSTRFGAVAYLNQEPEFLATEKPLLDIFRERTPQLSEDERRVRLARFLFPGPKAMQTCSSLSGGEKMRAALACVLNQDPLPRLLILDEPTNDLDLASVEQIEKALRELSCALFVVSHDPRFLEAIGIDHRLELS